jgi:hypothetical protein
MKRRDVLRLLAGAMMTVPRGADAGKDLSAGIVYGGQSGSS